MVGAGGGGREVVRVVGAEEAAEVAHARDACNRRVVRRLQAAGCRLQAAGCGARGCVHAACMVRARCVHGAGMVRAWCVHAACMLRAWCVHACVHGACMVRAWCVHAAGMVRACVPAPRRSEALSLTLTLTLTLALTLTRCVPAPRRSEAGSFCWKPSWTHCLREHTHGARRSWGVIAGQRCRPVAYRVQA